LCLLNNVTLTVTLKQASTLLMSKEEFELDDIAGEDMHKDREETKAQYL